MTINPNKIPIVLGVTGHHNLHLQEIELLKSRIREVLNLLRHHYPETPLLLLSPLAEGANRLVAHVAVEEKIPMIAPLPLPIKEYRRDFKTDACQQEFEELLNQVEDWFELPVLSENISQKNSVAQNTQYALVGAYMAGIIISSSLYGMAKKLRILGVLPIKSCSCA